MNARTMRSIRQLHLYLGLFFAPMLLLFAISGGLQVFRLNEEKGYGGPPPTWILWFASIHKNQAPPRDKPARAEAARSPSAADHRDDAPTAARAGAPAAKAPKSGALYALKIFTVLLAIALALTTVLGILIALNSRATRTTGLVMLAIGAALPILLLKL